MSIAERLAARAERGGCRLYEVLSVLDQADHDALQAELSQRRWSNQALSTMLKEEGFMVGKTTIGLHRTGQCQCYSPEAGN